MSIDRGPVTVLDSPVNFKFDQGSIENRTNFYDTKNNYIDYERSQRFPHHHLLALSEKIDTSVRTIMGCTPRNTKPPIREPNMPEKQEKKDEKKEKKKKKPVIRMEGGLADTNQNDPTLKAEGTLHDNLDVNLRHQWGVRLPEEVEKSGNIELQQSVGSGYQVPVYDTKNLQLTMSSSKDSESIDAKTEGQTAKRETAPFNNAKQVAKNLEVLESSKKVSPRIMTEGGVVDEDYNIPPGTHVDAEVTAWKELVLRSKVPVDPSKEQFIPEDGRQAEMLSIRPEAPRPKLDVQAVPTSNDETMNEEEDEAEFSSDDRTSFKPDTARAGSSADVHKLDSKKLHTGSACFTRKGSSRIFDTIDNGVGFVASQRALGKRHTPIFMRCCIKIDACHLSTVCCQIFPPVLTVAGKGPIRAPRRRWNRYPALQKTDLIRGQATSRSLRILLSIREAKLRVNRRHWQTSINKDRRRWIKISETV